MTKQEYLSSLELALKRKNVGDITEIVADYNEHFEAGAATGKSEQQIIIELGAVESIANEYVENRSASPYTQNFGNITNFYNASEKKEVSQKIKAPSVDVPQKSEKGREGGVLVKILAGLVYFVLGVTVAAICIGIAVGFVGAAIGLIVGGIGTAAGSWFLFGTLFIKLSGFFAGLALIVAGIFLCKLMKLMLHIVKAMYVFVVGLFKKAFGGN